MRTCIPRFSFMGWLLVGMMFGMIGCSKQQAPVEVRAADPLIAPEQMQAIQAGLFSKDEEKQLAALQALSSFPQMRDSYRDRIRELAGSSNDAIVEAAKHLQQ